MISAHGTLFLSKTAPLATRAADGTFSLTLHVVDSMGAFKKEPWCISYSGPEAERFWSEHRDKLTPGQPLQYQGDTIRVFTTARVPGITARALYLALAPRSATYYQPTQPEASTQ